MESESQKLKEVPQMHQTNYPQQTRSLELDMSPLPSTLSSLRTSVGGLPKKKHEQKPDTHETDVRQWKLASHVSVRLLFPNMGVEVSLKNQLLVAPSATRCRDSDDVDT